jgi:membrane protein YqaA with SNARE-associated domain
VSSEEPRALEKLSRKELIGLVLRLTLGLFALLAVAAGVSHAYRGELEAMGREFVERLGYGGMALGTLLADGFHFPIPPQFYMLLSISSGSPATTTMAVITAASLLGGYLGYSFAARLSRFEWISRKLQMTQRLTQHVMGRFGYKSAVMASIMPIAYSVLCYLAGLNRVPLRFFLVLALCRIPRLLVFYYLVYLGWEGLK